MKKLIAIVTLILISTNSANALRLNNVGRSPALTTSPKTIQTGEVEQYEFIAFPESQFGSLKLEDDASILSGESFSLSVNTDILFPKYISKRPINIQSDKVSKNGQCFVEINREEARQGKVAIRKNRNNLLHFSDKSFTLETHKTLSLRNLNNPEKNEYIRKVLEETLKNKNKTGNKYYINSDAKELLSLLLKTKKINNILEEINDIITEEEYNNRNDPYRYFNLRLSKVAGLTTLSYNKLSGLLQKSKRKAIIESLKQEFLHSIPRKYRSFPLLKVNRTDLFESHLEKYIGKNINKKLYTYSREFTVNKGKLKHKLICHLPKPNATYDDLIKTIGNSGSLFYKRETDLYYQDLSSNKDYSIFQNSRQSVPENKEVIAEKEEVIPVNAIEEV